MGDQTYLNREEVSETLINEIEVKNVELVAQCCKETTGRHDRVRQPLNDGEEEWNERKGVESVQEASYFIMEARPQWLRPSHLSDRGNPERRD